MKFPKVKIALVACLSFVLMFALSGCGVAKKAYEKLNEKFHQTGTAAAAFSEDVVRPPQVEVNPEGKADVTVLVYMNGSNLETDAGEATDDIAEMIAAGYSSNVNVVIQTMGTKKWHNYGISSRQTQRYEVGKNGLKLVADRLGNLSCTKASTLTDFISWGAVNYPAGRYELILWDHGAGPVYGYGYNETGDENDTLTLDEMQKALSDAGIYFDFIGMDCCLMSSLEVCCALRDYCDYTILSEDFESGLGWSYTNWLKKLRKDPTISTKALGQIIVDDMVLANERDYNSGSNAILSVIDEGMMKVLFAAWADFAYKNEDALLGKNYSMELSRARGGRDMLAADKRGLFTDLLFSGGTVGSSGATMSDYYVTDILATAQTINSAESKALSAALSEAIVYSNATSGDAKLTGLSVTLPYGDREFYQELTDVFTKCGLDKGYINWLGKFVSARGTGEFADYSGFESLWSGWDSYSPSYNWQSWDLHDQIGSWSTDYWNWDSNAYGNSWNRWILDTLLNY